MIKSLLRLWLATSLIVLASAILLLTDRERPRGGADSSGTDSGSAGKGAHDRAVPARLPGDARGRSPGRPGRAGGVGIRGGPDAPHPPVQRRGRRRARRIRSPGTIVGGDDDLIITLSTPSLQAVAGGQPGCEASARLRDGERPGRGRRRHLARTTRGSILPTWSASGRCSPWPRRSGWPGGSLLDWPGSGSPGTRRRRIQRPARRSPGPSARS